MMRVMLTGIAVAALATSMASAKEQAQIAASAEISEAVTLFELPEGSRPHDVAPAPDGKIWYTAQRQGALGILDPVTGKVVQVPLGPESAPHGVIQGPDGMAWITDGGQNAIVRYNPEDGKIDVWKLPEDTGYTNLNTGAFDGKGTHWFTGQNGVYGKVDAATGKVDVWKDPKGRGPYGIATAPDGTVWYVSLAGSHLAKIDSATGEISVIEPPTPGAGLRRVWADSQGDLWITGWNSGELYRYRPSNTSWKTWKLPGDAPKAYAVYVDERDMVWVSDFGDNSTRVFDPRTEKFTARYPGSGEGANVRQILGRKGEVMLPESGTERMMVIRTEAR
ncbi:PQQ-binding-like beta-propeller repeat protein [Blastomonas sp.]|uniref:Vgb family protein n=1 Tax=Blastomonas sp. TaxID=1909299 RepID=UPI00262B35FD|nr:PQQ-binding-like beta-propeller repeat protein [Blastomonas sp.]MDM7955850.1 PQQ-binding-like beta-propeller repeat protein [Blastomonas sp.]